MLIARLGEVRQRTAVVQSRRSRRDGYPFDLSKLCGRFVYIWCWGDPMAGVLLVVPSNSSPIDGGDDRYSNNTRSNLTAR